MIAFNNDPEFLRPGQDSRRGPEFTPPPAPQIRERQPEELLTFFFASLIVPGAGQVMRGQVMRGIVFFIAAVIAWFPPVNIVWPIVIVHLAAAVNALSRK